MPILDQYGKEITSALVPDNIRSRVMGLLRENRQLRARFDAAQTTLDNEGHWSNADRFDPHTTASFTVRATLRSRSRYEVQENNPFLKGTVLTICNDFVGSGPKLKITDKRISKKGKQSIELRWQQFAAAIKLRQKIWRMRMAKIVDGESFGKMFIDEKLEHPVPLNLRVYEGDQITSNDYTPFKEEKKYNEIDGVRFLDMEDVIAYHVLKYHPGGGILPNFLRYNDMGDWIQKKWMIHWFRQDRGWLRGIPETTASLPLCSILRRYTLAVLRHAEVQADLTGIIETEAPATARGGWQGTKDNPFETFPIEAGMMMNLPWGYKFKQVDAVPLGVQFDAFVGAMLREITRPLLTPYNFVIGSSKDANMSSAVVDTHIYKESQDFERLHCNEDVLDAIFPLWFQLGLLTPGYFDYTVRAAIRLSRDVIMHSWGWDKIGIDHTDPAKVAEYLAKMGETKYMTDRDVQETYFNRDVDSWREEVMEDAKFRETLPDVKAEREAAKKPAPVPGKPSQGKPPAKKPTPGKKASAKRPVTRRKRALATV